MYRGFNLTLSKTDPQKFMSVTDHEIRELNSKLERQKMLLKSKMESTLETNLDDLGNIDGSQLTNEWFPNMEADIFISHSHDDLRTVQRLAIWLEEKFGLTAFVDSSIWGSADELLKEIDDKYSILKKSKSGNNTYKYSVRNYTTAHVHMMLSAALMEMIDSTECVLFLNTPNSIKLGDYQERKTKSPWIYNELKITNIIEKKQPVRYLKDSYTKTLASDRVLKNYSVPDVDYDVSKELLKFSHLTRDDLVDWKNNYQNIVKSNAVHALDMLYLNKKIKKES